MTCTQLHVTHCSHISMPLCFTQTYILFTYLCPVHSSIFSFTGVHLCQEVSSLRLLLIRNLISFFQQPLWSSQERTMSKEVFFSIWSKSFFSGTEQGSQGSQVSDLPPMVLEPPRPNSPPLCSRALTMSPPPSSHFASSVRGRGGWHSLINWHPWDQTPGDARSPLGPGDQGFRSHALLIRVVHRRMSLAIMILTDSCQSHHGANLAQFVCPRDCQACLLHLF